MFLLTTGPRLYYVDPEKMTLKGQIPWSPQLSTEPKNFKAFFIHTVGSLSETRASTCNWRLFARMTMLGRDCQFVHDRLFFAFSAKPHVQSGRPSGLRVEVVQSYRGGL